MSRVHILIFFIILFAFSGLNAQKFIGLHKDDAVEAVKNFNRKLRLNTDVVNPKYNYLKFEDRITEQTMLLFLSDDNRVTYVRWMCDYSNINEVVSLLDESHKKVGENQWKFKDKGKIYEVKLIQEDWFFTVSIKEKKRK